MATRKKAIYVLIGLITLICASYHLVNNHNYSGKITRMEVFQPEGSIMFTVVNLGIERYFLVQGLNIDEIKRYEDSIDSTWSPIAELNVNIISYRHTYTNSDDVAFDKVEISSSGGNDRRNKAHVSPTLLAMLPYQSCRFIGANNERPEWLGTQTKSYQIPNGAHFYFNSSTGSHLGGRPTHRLL